MTPPPTDDPRAPALHHHHTSDDDMDAYARKHAELTAQTTVARLIDAAKDPETANAVVSVWVDAADRIIGRTVRRVALYLIIAAASVTAAKMGILEKIFPGGGK